MIELTRAPIDVVRLTDQVRSPLAGAVLLFLGTVRELTAGRRTLRLEYDAYEEMALAELARLEAEARQRWPLVACAMVHRLGELGLGEVSVAVAVSSPHRKDAFAAGQFLIDTLKDVVPIWKKEHWADGETAWIHPETGLPASQGETPP